MLRRVRMWTLIGAGVLVLGCVGLLAIPSGNRAAATATPGATMTPTTRPAPATTSPAPPAAPTVAPPPATPAASAPTAQPDGAEAEYRAFIARQSGELSRSFATFGDLMAAPRLNDTSWRVDLAAEFVRWQQAYQQAKDTTPPARFRAAHARYVEGLAKYDSASRDMIYFLDNLTAKDGQARATTARNSLNEGNALVSEAVKLMPQ